MRVSNIQRSESIPGKDVRIGAILDEDPRRFLAVQPRGCVQGRSLGNLAVIDALVDRRRIFVKSPFDVIAKVKRDGVMQ